MMTSNLLLRARLQQITCGGGTTVDSHPSLIADLAREVPHSIELAPKVPYLAIERYNCFEFALGLAGCPAVRLISEYLPSTFCNASFVQHLVDSILTPVASPSTGDRVLYCDHDQITHAGVITDDRILSKWGKGHSWIHGLLEVPTQYGDATSFYAMPPANDVLAAFIEFARQREGSELVDSILEHVPED